MSDNVVAVECWHFQSYLFELQKAKLVMKMPKSLYLVKTYTGNYFVTIQMMVNEKDQS